jgi:outer membrane biosynthesis protein TonB
MMGAFETVSGSEEAKAKDADIVSKGRSEIERGAAQMKGVAVPGSTTAGPESHVEGKTGDQPEKQPAKQEVPGTTPAPPPSPIQSRQAEPEPSRQEPAGQTGTENVQKSGQETKAGSSIPLLMG